MSARTDAKFEFGPREMKIIPLDGDLSTPLPLSGAPLTTLIRYGGVGPFDFSGVDSIAAVEMSIKIDNGTAETNDLNLSAAVDPAAVTAAELAAAIVTAAFTDIDAGVDSRGYLYVEYDPAATSITTEKYLQVYGEAAELGGFGQGAGAQFIYLNTQQSFSVTPTYKDAETITVTDSQGKDTEIISDAFRKGLTGTLVDTARDENIMAIIEGGTIDDYDGYTPPNSESVQKYFAIEEVRAVYRKGTNKEGDLIGYMLNRVFTCVGRRNEKPGDRNWAVVNYGITATEYTDPVTETKHSDSYEQYFTKAEWTTLDWANI
jgi:hypothetical protein